MIIFKRAILIFYLFTGLNAYSQNFIKKENYKLLDSLQHLYGELCTTIKPSSISSNKWKADKILVKALNHVYLKKESFGSLTTYLSKKGFTVNRKTKSKENKYDTITYYKHNGNLRGVVLLVTLNDALFAKKMVLATDTPFECPSKSGSFVYYYIDFLYLKKIINRIDFPMKVTNTNAELESR